MMTQARNGSSGNVEKWLNSGFMLKIEMEEFVSGEDGMLAYM